MSSCLLFHGPGAKAAAMQKAVSAGRLLAPPFGEDGLKTDDAREVVELLFSTPLGMDIGVIVVGPMDEANLKASDVLLKRIEEFRGDLILPILWAHDLGGVTPTIRSRCLEHWSPATAAEADEALLQAGRDLVSASLSGDYWRIAEMWGSDALKGKEIELLPVMAGVVSEHLDQEANRLLWERIRKVARWRNPVPMEVFAALVCG